MKAIVGILIYLNMSLFLIIHIVSEWVVQRDPTEEVLKAFTLFDDDGTGKISIRNLRRVARELGENMSEDELRAMIEEFDNDKDGESEYNEWMDNG